MYNTVYSGCDVGEFPLTGLAHIFHRFCTNPTNCRENAVTLIPLFYEKTSWRCCYFTMLHLHLCKKLTSVYAFEIKCEFHEFLSWYRLLFLLTNLLVLYVFFVILCCYFLKSLYVLLLSFYCIHCLPYFHCVGPTCTFVTRDINQSFLANVNSSSCSMSSSVRLSSVVCRLSSVCNVRAPYSDD